MKRFIFLLVLIVCMGSIVVLASQFSHSPLPSFRKPKVGTTIYALYDITKSIAGDKMDVILMLPPGASPHTYEPDPALLKRLQGSRVVFRIGNGIDDWVTQVAESQNIELMEVDRNIHLITHGDVTDPHYFLSLRNMPVIARTIVNKLIILDPVNKSYYEERFQQYTRESMEADLRISSQMQTLSQKNIVTLHDAWSYLARDYNLQIVGSFEPEGKEIKPRELALLNKTITENHITVVFSEPSLSSSVLENYARDNNLKIAVINPLESLGTYKQSYTAILESNLQTIYNALNST